MEERGERREERESLCGCRYCLWTLDSREAREGLAVGAHHGCEDEPLPSTQVCLKRTVCQAHATLAHLTEPALQRRIVQQPSMQSSLVLADLDQAGPQRTELGLIRQGHACVRLKTRTRRNRRSSSTQCTALLP